MSELLPALYLFPVNLSDAPERNVIPDVNFGLMRKVRHFIVENVRTARRFLKRCDREADIASMTFYELNRHTDPKEISSYLEPLRRGEAVGVMSEAGCPGVADPGAQAVAIAQREGLRVIPLVGPSSILLGLMASGFNGQGFCFNGYLPIEKGDRTRRLKDLEARAWKEDTTQIFIETPYRNMALLDTMLAVLRPETLVCIGTDITDPDKEQIVTMPVKAWRNRKPDLNKRPTVFLIYHP